MKVLEKGNPNGWEIEQYCTGWNNGDGGCGAKLLVAAEDIYLTSSTDLKEITRYYFTFKCPECGCETDIPEQEIPLYIQNKIYDARKN